MPTVLLLAAACPAADTRPATTAAAATRENPALTQGIIKLTPSEWELWEVDVSRPTELAVTEGPDGLKSIFYTVLSKTAALPALPGEQLEALDRPAHANLLKDPYRYVRLPVQAVRMRVKVGRVYKLLPGKGLAPYPERWPADKPVWQLACYDAAAKVAEEQPIIVYSTVDPGGLLPRPATVGEDNGLPYHQYTGRPPAFDNLPQLELAGIFYKVYSGSDKGVERNWPVVMAWQLRKSAGKPPGLHVGWPAIIVAAFAAAAILFWYIQRTVRRAKEAGVRPTRPRRGLQIPEPRTGGEGEEAAEVDPKLREAVEKYRQEKQGKDGQNDKS